jgi:ribosomal protein S18
MNRRSGASWWSDTTRMPRQTSRILSYCAFHIDYVALRKLRTPLITPVARDELLRRFVTEVDRIPDPINVCKQRHELTAYVSETRRWRACRTP